MIVEFERDNRLSLHRLFDDYPYMRGCITAILEDGAGKVYADSRDHPNVALAVLDFQFLAGDPDHENAPLLFNLLHAKESLIVPTPDWQQVITASFSGKMEVYEREPFQAKQFDIDKLKRFISKLPAGFKLRKICLEDVSHFAELSPSLIGSYPSPEDFVDKGVGMGIFHNGRFVSGASSSPMSRGKLEIEIQTHRQFRRRGFAKIVAAALILYCLKNGLEPCWDAANKPSSALAQELGFFSTGKYTAFWLP